MVIEMVMARLVDSYFAPLVGTKDPPLEAMGCKNSVVRENMQLIDNGQQLPEVPKNSWYAMPFTEHTAMEFTAFHKKNIGKVIFAKTVIPTRAQELDQMGGTLATELETTAVLGKDLIYGMGYLYQTALCIEHHWRTRVVHSPPRGKFDRPFYDMLLGVKVFINDVLVPDQFPTNESLPQCTATLRANEATTTWLCVPVVLVGRLEDPVLRIIDLYRSLSASFAQAATTLQQGQHRVRVEIVYGCKSENNFCTDFIARGELKLIVNEQSAALIKRYARSLVPLLQSRGKNIIPVEPSVGCAYCGHQKRFRCAVCGALVCGSPQCVWSKFVGYPHGCSTHQAQF